MNSIKINSYWKDWTNKDLLKVCRWVNKYEEKLTPDAIWDSSRYPLFEDMINYPSEYSYKHFDIDLVKTFYNLIYKKADNDFRIKLFKYYVEYLKNIRLDCVYFHIKKNKETFVKFKDGIGPAKKMPMVCFLYLNNYFYFMEFMEQNSNSDIILFSEDRTESTITVFDMMIENAKSRSCDQLLKELGYLQNIYNQNMNRDSFQSGYYSLKDEIITCYLKILAEADHKNSPDQFDIYLWVFNRMADDDFRWTFFLTKKGLLQLLRDINFRDINNYSLMNVVSNETKFNLTTRIDRKYRSQIISNELSMFIETKPLTYIFDTYFGISNPMFIKMVIDLITKEHVIKADLFLKIKGLILYFEAGFLSVNLDILYKFLEDKDILLHSAYLTAYPDIMTSLNFSYEQFLNFVINSTNKTNENNNKDLINFRAVDYSRTNWLINDTNDAIELIKEHGLWDNFINTYKFKDYNNMYKLHDLVVRTSQQMHHRDFDLTDGQSAISELDGIVQNDYRIEVPISNYKLIEFGTILHNCVGNYGRKIVRKESFIFGIYYKNEITYCVELVPRLNNLEIRQFLGKYNESVSDEIKKPFIELLSEKLFIVVSGQK